MENRRGNPQKRSKPVAQPSDYLARLQAIEESFDDAIVSETLEGTIVSWNRAAELIFGWSAGQAIGQSISIITPSNLLEESKRILDLIKHGKSVKHVRTERVRKHGSTIAVSLSLAPVFDSNGKVIGAYTIARDVSQQLIEEANKQLLLRAGETLASSLDSEDILVKLASIAVPDFADWCAVHLLTPDGQVRRVAVKHDDPDKVRWAEALDTPGSLNEPKPGVLSRVLRTGKPELFSEIDDSSWEAFKLSGEKLALVHNAGIRSALVVALQSRGLTIGSITFVSATSGRFTERELLVAEELGRRAGLAVDNARLFSSLENELKERVRAEFRLAETAEELRVLYEAGKELGSSLEPNRIYRALQGLVAGVMECENMLVSSFDNETKDIRCEFAFINGKVADHAKFPAIKLNPDGHGMQSAVIVSGKSNLIKNLAEKFKEPGTKYLEVNDSGKVSKIRTKKDTDVNAIMMVPMLLEGRTFGVVQVMSHDREAYQEEDLRLLEGIVVQLSAACRNALLYQQTKRAEDRYRTLVSAMTSVVWEANANGEFVAPQRSWQAFTGQTWAQHKGRGWIRAVHPQDIGIATRAWLKGLKNRRSESGEARMWSAEHNQYRYTLTRAVPILDETGQVKEWVGTVSDIHDRKISEDHSRFMLRLNDRIRTQDSADKILNAVVTVLGEHLQASRCTYSHIDHARSTIEIQEEYLDGVESRLGSSMIQETDMAFLDRLTKGEVVVIEDGKKDHGTKEFWETRFKSLHIAALVSVPIVKNNVLQGVLSVQDRSPRLWSKDEVQLAAETAERAWLSIQTVQADRELKQLNAELELRVAQRTAELQAATREMEGFTYTVSHDLRGPLRAIMSSSMILIEDFGEELKPEAQRLLERQANAAKRLGQLIDDVLKLSRLGRTDLNKTQVDLTALANEVVRELKPSDLRKVDVKVESGLQALGDPQLLKLALQNLIENSVKFGKSDAITMVEIGLCRSNGTDVVFVKDNGIGFEQQYVDKIFIPFERLHRDDEYPGTGIGLANVKRIIERHGGKVWAEGNPGEGATFFFTL